MHGEGLLSCRYTGFVNGKRYLPWRDSDVDELKQVTKLPGTYKGVPSRQACMGCACFSGGGGVLHPTLLHLTPPLWLL